jgi:hypothetical protein
VLFKDPYGEKDDRLLSIERLNLLRVHILNVVDLGKGWADEHRQPNEKQTNQVRNDVHFAGIHGLIPLLM